MKKMNLYFRQKWHKWWKARVSLLRIKCASSSKTFCTKWTKSGKIWTGYFHWKTVWYFNKFLFISNAFLEETQFIMIAILQIWKLHTFLDLLWWTYRNWETCTLKFGNILFRNLVTIYMYNIDFPTMLVPGKMSLGS